VNTISTVRSLRRQAVELDRDLEAHGLAVADARHRLVEAAQPMRGQAARIRAFHSATSRAPEKSAPA
jgi:hypothetical protein